MFTAGFHPFQGRPSFGLHRRPGRQGLPCRQVSIPFREDLHSDSSLILKFGYRRPASFHPFQGRPSFGREVLKEAVRRKLGLCFHPFQGRPSFGQEDIDAVANELKVEFPSLSGKTFIRTLQWHSRERYSRMFPSLSGKTFIRTRCNTIDPRRLQSEVSIPFREDLHSDMVETVTEYSGPFTSFHPFQGRPSFGLRYEMQYLPANIEVSIPFREDLHSDYASQIQMERGYTRSFHPFQGRPSFGQILKAAKKINEETKFPSLSGKTFIRTLHI